MPALTAANVIVTLNPEDIDRSPDGRIGMRTFPTVAFGNAALTYPALGIPMPALGKFGFHFAIKRAYIEQPANGFVYHFDRANHKLRIFQGAAQAAVTCNAITAGTPTGVVTGKGLTIDAHSHGLELAANTGADPPTAVGANATGPKLQANAASNILIPGGVTANGGVANATATGNLASNALTIAEMGTHTHGLTGGTAVAAGALVELGTGAGDAPAATTLYMEMVGR